MKTDPPDFITKYATCAARFACAAGLGVLLLLSLGRCGSSSGASDAAGQEIKVGSGDTHTDKDSAPVEVDGLPGDSEKEPDVAEIDSLVDSTVSVPDFVPGSKSLGETCVADLECESGICWRTKRGSGCTVACTGQADCQSLGGLVCVYLGEGIKGCAPPADAASMGSCTNNADCLYPSVCVQQFGWCDLPECTFDADCQEGELCREGFRECEPAVCVSTYQCVNPLDYCLGGKCGPAACSSRDDCQPGEICHKVQGICTQATPCQEGACSYYNQICVDGLCEPNLCTNPCSHAGDVCNPNTGKCGVACADTADCPAGYWCEKAGGVCEANLPPVAAAKVVYGGKSLIAANVKTGQMAMLDASDSYDPEGETLEYWWGFADLPPGAVQNGGDILCNSAACPFVPLVPGLHQFVLVVSDPLGEPSSVAQATILAIDW